MTGGGRGLGRAIAHALAERGADVALSYNESARGAEEVQAALRALGRRAFAFRADARQPGQMAAFVEAAAAALGGLDLLVNNVGVFRRTPVGEITEDVLDEAFDVNAKAAVLAAQAAAPHLRRRPGAAIVNVASLGGLMAWPHHVAYSASKAALIAATRGLAAALAPIRVNAVAPGVLEPPGGPAAVRDKTPLARFGSHAEAVEAVLFLAGAATFTTGEVLRVDGGRALAT